MVTNATTPPIAKTVNTQAETPNEAMKPKRGGRPRKETAVKSA